jgi:hypothetical protein
VEGYIYPPENTQPPGTRVLTNWWHEEREDNKATTVWDGYVKEKDGYALYRVEGFVVGDR